MLLVPLVGALFSDTPQRALVWLGWLTAATVTGWVIDTATARIGFDLGFAVLDHSQHDVADRLPRGAAGMVQRREHRDGAAGDRRDRAGTRRPRGQPADAADHRDSVARRDRGGVVAGVVAARRGRPGRRAADAGRAVGVGATGASRRSAAAAEANTALTERIIEFARTQQALRAARRVEPARSLVGDALAAQHGATMRLLAMQVPGQLLFSLASQLALILFAGATTALTVNGTLTVAGGDRPDRRDRALPRAVHHRSASWRRRWRAPAPRSTASARCSPRR